MTDVCLDIATLPWPHRRTECHTTATLRAAADRYWNLRMGWLRVVARVNPLTYQVDALRALMIVGGESQFGLTTDIAVLTLAVAILTMICARLYPNLVR